MRILRFMVFVVVSSLGISSCAPGPGQTSLTDNPKASTPGPSTSSTPEMPRGRTAAVDIGLISGVAVSGLTFGGIRSDVLQAPAFPGLTLAQEGVRNQILQRMAWSGRKTVDLKWRLNSAGADSVVLNAEVSGGDEKHFATIVYDAAADQAYNSNVLIEPARWKDFVAAVGSAEGGSEVAALLKEGSYPLGDGPAFSFTTDGGLLIQGRNSVEVPPDRVPQLLTPLGRRALAGVTSPTRVQAPDQVAKPQPDATGTDTPDSGRPRILLRPDCQRLKCIALTFDDGPVAETSGLVEMLQTRKVPVTFFTLGKGVQAHPDVVRQMAALGNQVGWHTATHRDLVRLTADEAGKEISSGASMLSKLIGGAPLLFRPPYGSHSASTDALAGTNHMASIFWNIDTRDWDKSKTQGPALTQAVISSVVAGARPGAIVLMHDIHDTSRAAAGPAIDQLRAQGYTFVTVGDLPSAQSLTWGKNFCLGRNSEAACN